MKKILLIFMAFMIFAYPVHTAMFPQQADAAVASKVASQAAKKIAKEVIVDEAINTAMNFALMEAIEIADNYQAKEGYKVVCPSGGSTCDKPIQVKTSFSDSDKSALRGQTEIELEKAITGGKGLTKWQKFLDWFVPVWITSFAATALTYAIDPNARNLFNEVGYNALVSLGFITPITSNEIIPIDQVELPQRENEDEITDTVSEIYRTLETNNYATTSIGFSPGFKIPMSENVLIQYDYRNLSGGDLNLGKLDIHTTWDRTFMIDFPYNRVDGFHTSIGTLQTMKLSKDGVTISEVVPVRTTAGTDRAEFTSDAAKENIDIIRKKTTSILHRMPYKIGDFYYTDVLFNTPSGKYVLQGKHTDFTSEGQMVEVFKGTQTTTPTTNIQILFTVHTNEAPNKKILPPVYEEIETQENIMKKSSYEDENGNIALVPPTAITYEEEATGEQVERKPNATGDGYVFEKPDGTIVPEEQVHVPPTWEPNITPSPTPIPNPGGNPDPYPEGTPQITPSPTPSNPNPEPIPLTPSPTPQPEPNPETPPGNPPPPVETTEPYFPEGETCDVGLKIPKFLPLAHSISETFPFSIPFDLYGGFEALFIEMGSERPEFEFAFDFMGKEQSWTIAIPEYFDSWKPFTDSVLIFIFDVGIIYAIYRFMGGGS